MVMFYRAMAKMAHILHREAEADTWSRRGIQLQEAVNQRLWDPVQGAYVDRWRETGAFSQVLSPASFMPLFLGIVSSERAKKLAAIAEKRFVPGAPTVSRDNPEFQSDRSWRGPTWLNTAYFMLKGLKNAGFDELAERGRGDVLGWVEHTPEAIFEYYDSDTGRGIGAAVTGAWMIAPDDVIPAALSRTAAIGRRENGWL